MPKVIQPRRHDKTLSVEDYWRIKDQNANRKAQAPKVASYREQQVLQRHRYQRPSEQAKIFDPLEYLLRAESAGLTRDQQALTRIGDDESQTAISEYLKSVQFRVSPPLVEIKSLALGRTGTLYNMPRILKILLENLQVEESWLLLQAALRDLRGQRLQFWLQGGLRLLAGLPGSPWEIGTAFSRLPFRRLFDTLCVLMETSFQAILTHLESFFLEMTESFFKHPNKYVRKFSLVSFSYLLANLPDQQYRPLLVLMCQLQQQGKFHPEAALPHLLLQRLRPLRGCLTATGLANFLDHLTALAQLLPQQPQPLSPFVETSSQLIANLLDSLNNKRGPSDEQILFDFNYVLKALTGYVSNHPEQSTSYTLGLAKFLAKNRNNEKKFSPFTPAQTRYVEEAWTILSDHFCASSSHLIPCLETFEALGMLFVKRGPALYYHSQLLNFCIENSECLETIIQVAYESGPELQRGLMEVLLLLSKSLIKSFLTGEGSPNLIYTLVVLLKRAELVNLIDLSWLETTSDLILDRLESANFHSDLLVVLRLARFIKLQVTQDQANRLENLQKIHLQKYENLLQLALEKQSKKPPSGQEFYNSSHFIRELIVYSHHEIGWLSFLFTLYESFRALRAHLVQCSPNIQPSQRKIRVWNELIIERSSSVSILAEDGYFGKKGFGEKYIGLLLRSRNREARYNALELLRDSENEKEKEIVEILLKIDERSIDIDNQRQIKRLFCSLEKQIGEWQLLGGRAQMFGYLLEWSIGFGFTGFKLIQKAFISFFALLLPLPYINQINSILMPFLEYYQYRHSRQYQKDLSPSNLQNHLSNYYNFPPLPYNHLIQEDFNLYKNQTVQWIGLERIAEAIASSPQGKINLGSRLQALVETYFEVQFQRQKQTILQGDINSPKEYLLPVKQRYLVTILKLCPLDYLPPLNCLHMVRQEYLSLPKVQEIKRHKWESLWERKKSQGPKKRDFQIVGGATTIDFERMSEMQKELYIHYLWKDIVEVNHQKRRAIIDHVRNYLPSAAHLLFTLLNRDLFIDDLNPEDSQSQATLLARLKLVNRKTLLNKMYILKTLLAHLKSIISQEHNFKTILLFVLTLIQLVYTHNSNHPQQSGQNSKMVEEQDEQQEQDQGNKNQKEALHYKQHRKQLQKILQTFFSNHSLEQGTIRYLLQPLLSRANTQNLGRTVRHSLPGLLIVLKIVSNQKQACYVLATLMDNSIIQILANIISPDQQGNAPLPQSYEVWLTIAQNIILVSQEPSLENTRWQSQIDTALVAHTGKLLHAISGYLGSKKRKEDTTNGKKAISKDEKQVRLLKLVLRLMELHSEALPNEWENYLWDQLNKLSRSKKALNDKGCERLAILIRILSRYIHLGSALGAQGNPQFLRRIAGLLPQIREPSQRAQINALVQIGAQQLGLSEQIVSLVSSLTRTKRVGLAVEVDYSAFFEATGAYSSQASKLGLLDHEYFLFNLLCFLGSGELSMRRAVGAAAKDFLREMTRRGSQNSEIILLVLKAFRVLIDQFRQPDHQANDSIFWGIVGIAGSFFFWLVSSSKINCINAELYRLFVPWLNQNQEDFFNLISSISEVNKLKAVRKVKALLEKVSQQAGNLHIGEGDIAFPQPFSGILLPILQYLVMAPSQPRTNHSTNGPQGNLSSTLALESLEILPLLGGALNEGSAKRELKRLVSKLKFSETCTKRNLAIIRTVSQLVDGLRGAGKIGVRVKDFIQEHGFEQFHATIINNARAAVKEGLTMHQDSEDEDEERGNRITQKQKIPDYFQNLEELESQQAINRNFMSFDKKLMAIQEEHPQENSLSRFLRTKILLPLKTMLFFESKGKEADKQQGSKGRAWLSVAVTKVLLRLPLELFLREFQKVVSRLGRLLKKRNSQVRENARSCLVEIAKAVGPQLLYVIVLELKFHLRDNFDKHVFNFTVFRVLQKLHVGPGDLDYCLPLILPMTIDEIFGRTGEEKEMVERGEVPTLKLESKKRKGLDLLLLLCRQVSIPKVTFIIDYLQKFLREYLVTEVNLSKYDQMLTAIANGLASNPNFLNPQNAPLLLRGLQVAFTQLRLDVRSLVEEQGPRHESTLRTDWNSRKVGKKQALSLQEEAGRNGSIFRRLTAQAGSKRNQQILVSSLIQFHLVLLSLLLRKQVLNPSSASASEQVAKDFLGSLGFACECLDHRDNRIVSRCLRLLHLPLNWNTGSFNNSSHSAALKNLRKRVSRKILLLVQKLTMADEELLRECFLILNDIFTQTAINREMLPNLLAIIKLHTAATLDEASVPEAYQLLRTLFYKCPLLLFDPLLLDMHYFTRIQMLTTPHKEIRDICRSISAIYLRSTATLQPSISAVTIQTPNGKKGHSQSQFKKTQEQLTFYLGNLQPNSEAAQQSVLELLREYVQNRQQAQLQQISELLLLGLMTARTNQGVEDGQHRYDKLVGQILRRVSQGKILSLIQKCGSWLKSERKSAIKICGSSFLRLILEAGVVRLGTKSFIDRFIAGEGIINQIVLSLQKEVELLEIFKENKISGGKVDKQWAQILDKMENQEDSHYQHDSSLVELLKSLKVLISQNQIRQIYLNIYHPLIIPALWKLLHAQSHTLVNTIISTLEAIPTLSALHSYRDGSESQTTPFLDQKHPFSIRKTLASLLFNSHSSQTIFRLLHNFFIQDRVKIEANEQVPWLLGAFWLLLGLALKAHAKYTIYQQVLPCILSLISRLTHKDPTEIDLRSYFLSRELVLTKLIEIVSRLGNNQLVETQTRGQVEAIGEELKEYLGTGEYFRRVGEIQSRRKSYKTQEKKRVAQLAVLDPQSYIETKTGRKRQQ